MALWASGWDWDTADSIMTGACGTVRQARQYTLAMTDPAGVTRQDAPEPALPDLGDLIRAGEWRRALATARVRRADPSLE